MKTRKILSIMTLAVLGLCLLCGLTKMAMKGLKAKQSCDYACSLLVFVALVFVGVSQLLKETGPGPSPGPSPGPADKITTVCTPILKTGGTERLKRYNSITGGKDRQKYLSSSIADTWGNLLPQTLAIKTTNEHGLERDCYLRGMDDNTCTNLRKIYDDSGCTPPPVTNTSTM